MNKLKLFLLLSFCLICIRCEKKIVAPNFKHSDFEIEWVTFYCGGDSINPHDSCKYCSQGNEELHINVSN